MTHQDTLLRFSFDQLDIRGELVYLDESWENVLSRHAYPPAVQRQLGTALAAVALLSLSIKYEGTMILQIQGKGPLRSLVTQITHTGNLRGLARWEGLVPDGSLQDIFGDGQMLISVMKEGGDRYQSIVSLDGDSLCAALNSYFQQSEQLPSNFQLFVNADRVCGLFLQALPKSSRGKRRIADDLRLPDAQDHDENWNRITTLASTLREEEMFTLPPERLLFNLFNEEMVRLHDPRDLRFACTCSKEKVQRTLVTMGEQELLNIIHDEGSIKVTCEFCNHHYEFDTAAVAALFAPDAGPGPGTVVH